MRLHIIIIGYKKLDTFLFGFLLTFSISFRMEMSCVHMREKEREGGWTGRIIAVGIQSNINILSFLY